MFLSFFGSGTFGGTGCKLPRLTIDRDTWNSQKQEKSSSDTIEEVALERLRNALEENLSNPRMKTFLQDGKRRNEQTCTKTTSKKKRLKLDPLVGWGKGRRERKS